jgi:hypothetical protein
MIDAGIAAAGGRAIPSPLPVSWLGRVDSPPFRPDWATVGLLTSTQNRNLLAQIAYDQSRWDYNKVGTNNLLGRYQFSTQKLEDYGIIMPGSNQAYGADCVNFRHCWKSTPDSYAFYNYDVSGLTDFLSNSTAQEHLAYELIYDLFIDSIKIGVIKITDTAEVVAGMLYVCWELGVGTPPDATDASGTGAYAWRYSNLGTAARYYNSGRYAVNILSR